MSDGEQASTGRTAEPAIPKARLVPLWAAAAASAAFALGVSRDWLEVHFARDYCATGAGDERRMLAVRITALLFAACLVAFAPAIVRRVRRSPRAALGAILRTGAAALFALVLCDVVLRLAGKSVPLYPPPNPLFMGDPEIGGVYVPNMTLVEKSKDSDATTTYVIDRLGYRDARQDAVPDTAAPTLLFAGESVTTGTTVTYEEAYPALVGERLGIQSVNIGVAGFANDQAYLWSLRAMERFPGTRALVMLLVPRQLERNVRGYAPRLAPSGDGKLAWVQPSPAWWLTSPVRALGQAVVGYHDDEAMRVARAAFLALDRAAAARGVPTLFVMTSYGAPCADPPGRSPIEHEVFGGTALRWLRVDVDPAWHVGGDEHPDARGHRAIADAVERALRDMGIGAR